MNYFEGEKIQVAITSNTIRIGEEYKIGLRISGDYGFINDAYVIMNQQKGTNQREIRMNYISTENYINFFECNVDFQNLGLHYFCFKLVINGIVKWIKYDTKNRRVFLTNANMPYWTITVYDHEYKVPEWTKGKIMYQIFPDRFFSSSNYVPEKIEGRVTKKWGEIPNWAPAEDGEIHNNDFFMGNIRGIEEKLDYLQEMGVDIIYLNPICMSQSNHRYDAADYKTVDPYVGTAQDLKNLCSSAHDRGMHIVLDGVFNHTGNDSIYFNQYGKFNSIGAFQSSSSPYYNWFRKDGKGEFEYWWGFKNLPVCDGNNPGWQNYVYGEGGVIDYWFSLGIDGIRLDVADELTDEFIENIRIAVKRNKPDGFLLGEVWDNAVTKEGYGKQRTYLLGKGLDSVMNYPYTNAILKYVRFGKYKYLTQTIDEILTQYPNEMVYSLMNSLSTHDITRAMTTLVGEGIQKNEFNWIWDVPFSRDWQINHTKMDSNTYNKGKKMLKVATAIQYFLPGNPCIYYGDEVGMYGYRDPFNRMCFPWDNIDEDIHRFYVELGKARKQVSNLDKAKYRVIKADEKIFAFERYDEAESTFIAINRSEEAVNVDIPEKYKNGRNLFTYNSAENTISNYGIIIKSSK